MGELSSTVAHEIRNPLNAIAMSAQRLEQECLPREGGVSATEVAEAAALVGVIRQETHRINAKVQQFLDFARPPALALRPTDLRQWLASLVTALDPLAGARGVTLTLEKGPEAQITIDPEQMRQAVENLLRNAVEATPAGGNVTIGSTLAPGEWTLEVHDTGSGIPPDVLPKIFDLYFTTKTAGTGVGLAVTQQIVSAHGGIIEVESSPDQGTSMRIRAPRDTGRGLDD
jgi:signal transduction histidine kinase